MNFKFSKNLDNKIYDVLKEISSYEHLTKVFDNKKTDITKKLLLKFKNKKGWTEEESIFILNIIFSYNFIEHQIFEKHKHKGKNKKITTKSGYILTKEGWFALKRYEKLKYEKFHDAIISIFTIKTD